MLINEATWCGSYTKCKQLHQALTLFHSYARKFAQLRFAQFGLLLNPEKSKYILDHMEQHEAGDVKCVNNCTKLLQCSTRTLYKKNLFN